jgi:hypothetical protein
VTSALFVVFIGFCKISVKYDCVENSCVVYPPVGEKFCISCRAVFLLITLVRVIIHSGKPSSVCSNPNEPPSLAWSGMGEKKIVWLRFLDLSTSLRTVSERI